MYKLKELEYTDLEEINTWRNNKELIDQLGATYRYINFQVDEKWYDNYMKNRGTCVRCSIIDENNTLIGLVSLTNINWLNQSAEFHIMIGDPNRQGKGAGDFAVKEMLKHAFNNLNLHRIELTVLVTNKRAQHLYEKNGFEKEGTLRKVYYKNGEFVDAYMYAILREDYVE